MRPVDGNPYPAPGNPPGNGLPAVAHLAHAPGFAPDDSRNDAHVPLHPAPLPLAVAGMAKPSAASPNASSQKSLSERAVNAVKLGPKAWYSEWHSLKPEERTSFLTTGLQEVVKLGRPRLCQYKAALHAACCRVGRDALLAQSLLPASDLIPLLIKLDLNRVLADILATEAGRQALLEANKRDMTPLHVAAVNNNRKAVRLLLLYAEDAAALRMKPDAKGWLPLHHAAWVGAADAARYLLQDKGKGQRLSPTKANHLPLDIAIVYAANAAMVRLLLEDCAKEQTTVQAEPLKSIALMLAAHCGLADIVKVLLNVKPTLAQQLTMRDSKGKSALDYAKQSGDAATIKLLEDALQSLPAASSSSTSTSTATTSTHAYAGSDAPVPLTPYPATPAPGMAGAEEATEEGEPDLFF
jgi:ankyrin repeat protein